VRVLNCPFHITDTAGAFGRRGIPAHVPPPKHLAKDETRHIISWILLFRESFQKSLAFCEESVVFSQVLSILRRPPPAADQVSSGTGDQVIV